MRLTCLVVFLLSGLSLGCVKPADQPAAAVTDSSPAAEAKSDDAAEQSAEFVDLFDGKTLDGWTVTECEAVVKDGAIMLVEGNGFVRTNEKYADYVLQYEWKALADDNWDSGVYFRCKLPPDTDRPWPHYYQANLLKGMEGNVKKLKGAESTGLVKPGEWNHFQLTVKGTKAELDINGKPAWKADGLEDPDGYIGLQAEVAKGGQFLFRNIRIKVLK